VPSFDPFSAQGNESEQPLAPFGHLLTTDTDRDIGPAKQVENWDIVVVDTAV
jgi:hypothetical protein